MRRCSITNESFAHFAKMENLTRIRAVKTYISDGGLEHLRTMKKLEALGILALTTLSKLETLDIHACRHISIAGVTKLQAAKPNLHIRQ